jgi:hypothetical protein
MWQNRKASVYCHLQATLKIKAVSSTREYSIVMQKTVVSITIQKTCFEF